MVGECFTPFYFALSDNADEISLPIWLWPQVITMFMVLGATLSNDWSTFTTFRSLQGLFGTVPQVIGLPIIHDMYSAEGMLSIEIQAMSSNESRMAPDDQYLVIVTQHHLLQHD